MSFTLVTYVTLFIKIYRRLTQLPQHQIFFWIFLSHEDILEMLIIQNIFSKMA